VAGDIVWVTIAGDVFAFTVTHGAHRARETRDHDAFMPPMSATVVRIAAKVGDRVQAGDVLIALEAMKMELPIKSPRDGVVRAINCREGELVQPDQVLIELE
jgi:biotin carboxyl carrier protein